MADKPTKSAIMGDDMPRGGKGAIMGDDYSERRLPSGKGAIMGDDMPRDTTGKGAILRGGMAPQSFKAGGLVKGVPHTCTKLVKTGWCH